MKKLDTVEFVKRANFKFDFKFDYSKSVYLGMKIPMEIICPIHGSFHQTPDTHLNKGNCGCPKCRSEFIVKSCKERDYSTREYKTNSKDEFLSKCLVKYGDKFVINLDEFERTTMDGTISVNCSLHGVFYIRPVKFLEKQNKHGCPKCNKEHKIKSKSISYSKFVDRASKCHNYKYTYPLYDKNYTGITSKIEAICKFHGPFFLSASKHCNGQGCHHCLMDKKKQDGELLGGYSEEFFLNNENFKSVPAILYYIKIDNGKYYKIGISKNSTKDRIKSLKFLSKKNGQPRKFEIIDELNLSLYEAFQLEQKILSTHKQYRIFRRWSTELFSVDLLQGISLEVFANSLSNLS
jgi:hypothetical protein